LMVKRSRMKSLTLKKAAEAIQQTNQMCPIDADFKHFRAAKA